MHVMIRSLAARRLFVVAVTSMVSLAACGSSSKSNAGATNTSAAAKAAGTTAVKGAASTAAKGAGTIAAESGNTPTTAAKSSSAGGSGGSFADNLVAAITAVAQGDCSKAAKISESMNTGGDGAEALTQLGALGTAMDKLASSGPSELRADFATLAKAYGALSKAYADLGIDDPSKIATALADPAKAEQFQKLGSLISAPDVQAASDRIGKWVEEKCPGLK